MLVLRSLIENSFMVFGIDYIFLLHVLKIKIKMKISLIMLVKNSMPYIMASLQSFLEQDYKNKELIIVYSKSDDGSFEYLNNKKTKNIKIYFLNKNLYSCLNYGIKKSKGEVISILHSDDILYDKNVLSDVAKSFIKKGDIVYGNIIYSKK